MSVPQPPRPASSCPNCFAPLLDAQWAFRCVNPPCPERPDHALSAATGSETLLRTVTTVTPDRVWQPDLGAICSACSVATTQEVCPGCHYDLMSGWRLNTTVCVALAGARASGKSIYIAVLVKQAQLWSARNGRVFLPGDARTAEVYQRSYETPLYVQRGLIPPTPSAAVRGSPHRDPLIFQIGSFNGVPHLLVLRDVAGEDLEDPDTPTAPFRFFSAADLVLFLFDPMQVAEIQDQLAGLVPDQRLRGGDPVTVLGNLIRLIRGGPLLGGARLNTQLALVLAKFDVLAQLAEVQGSPLESIMDNRGASYNIDPSLDRHLDLADLARLQAEVESLLTKLHAQSLLNLVENTFTIRQTFAVSALGALPYSADRVNFHGIAPFRVLDPLKWVLARKGTIPTG